jgi:hypothetical protein
MPTVSPNLLALLIQDGGESGWERYANLWRWLGSGHCPPVEDKQKGECHGLEEGQVTSEVAIPPCTALRQARPTG